jgi:hypothetical protein
MSFLVNSYIISKLRIPWIDSSLLLHGDGTDGTQNNTFRDSSSNDFTITRNGTPTQGSFSPYGNSWSNYFNGTTDYFRTLGNSWTQLGTGDFTIECWIYKTTNGGLIIDTRSSTSIVPWQLGAGNQIDFAYFSPSGNSTLRVTGTSTIPLNTWTHLAVSRSSGLIRVFVNGTQENSRTVTDAINGGTALPYIGRTFDTTGTVYFGGYISNLRVVIGSSLYSSNFTPPTSPLTAVAGTSLLTCQSNSFKDNSSNNFTIIAYGTPSVSLESPFKSTSAYSPTVNGGSGYFNGVSDFLTCPANTAFEFSSGTFTVEAWVNFKSVAGEQPIATTWSSSTAGWSLLLLGGKLCVAFSGTTADITGTMTILTDTWYHVAVAGSTGSYKLFVNGVQEGATYTGATVLAGSTLGIAKYPTASYYFNGYISNLRVVNGTAVYTTNFTPPTSPVTAVANTSLLCNFTNAGIFDSAKKNNLLTVGTARVSTAEKKFGTGSMLFNGSTDYLSTINKQDLSLGSGNFTIECWVYANSIGSFNGVFAQWPNNGGSVNNSFVLESVGSNMMFYWCEGSTLFGPATLGTITTGSWIYYAICRSGNILYPFKNGILGTTVSITQTLNSPTSNITVGGLVAGSGYWDGYIDDLRITKGVARYTANFTPPTQALPDF